MGLALYQDDNDDLSVHWSYVGFHIFRKQIAKTIGIEDLDQWWEALPATVPLDGDDPIIYLLNHSDCDGELTPEDCDALVCRLRAIILSWDKQTIEKHGDRANKLCDLLEYSAETKQTLEFR